MPWSDRDLYEYDPQDDGECQKCHGDGDVPGRRMGVIGPWSERSDRPGDYYICPRCGGTGRQP